jgi:hypothetical protein
MLFIIIVTYPIVATFHRNTNVGWKHSLLIIECKKIIVAIISYATRITITTTFRFLVKLWVWHIYDMLELSARFLKN